MQGNELRFPGVQASSLVTAPSELFPLWSSNTVITY